MFICRQAEIELIDLDMDDNDSKGVRDQWWRIHYAPMGSNPITVEVSHSPLLSLFFII